MEHGAQVTTTIQVSRGLCAPMRDDVLTALKPFGVKILAFDCWGEGHWYLPVAPTERVPDGGEIGKWARRHIATITVSDKQWKWAERLLWQSGKVWLDSEPHPLNKELKWEAPPACTAGEHGRLGRGTMPTPWSTQKRQPRAKRTTRRTREQQQVGGVLGMLARLLR